MQTFTAGEVLWLKLGFTAFIVLVSAALFAWRTVIAPRQAVGVPVEQHVADKRLRATPTDRLGFQSPDLQVAVVSRKPDDIPAFNRATIELFARDHYRS